MNNNMIPSDTPPPANQLWLHVLAEVSFPLVLQMTKYKMSGSVRTPQVTTLRHVILHVPAFLSSYPIANLTYQFLCSCLHICKIYYPFNFTSLPTP